MTPSAGAIQLAEPPPEISTSNRSSAVACCASASVSAAPFSPASSGTGWPASTTRDSPRRHAMAVPGGGDPQQSRRLQFERVEIMPLGGGGHRGGALAGGEADHPAFRYRAQMLAQHDIGMSAAPRPHRRSRAGEGVGRSSVQVLDREWMGAGYPSNPGKRKPPRAGPRGSSVCLSADRVWRSERFQAKWLPVRVKKTRPNEI